MNRKTLLWILFSVVTLACGVFAVKYFSLAYPIISVEIEIDREQAIQKAKDLAKTHNWAFEDGRDAASFRADSRIQNYVELEAGGVNAFREMIGGSLYSPYFWVVRLFKVDEVRETNVYFTPAGEFNGFREKIPEEETGAALTADSALVIAVASMDQWQIDLQPYELIEKSQEVRPSGRIDHHFTYERKDVKIGEAEYRLSLTISGDKLTEINHSVNVPEAFDIRYEEMRSANNTIAIVAIIAMILLYIIGGIVFGLFYLLKKRWILWRKALIWGAIVALFQTLIQINQWPLLWMSYDTALSMQGFIFQQIIQIALTFVGFTGFLTLIFMVAESLSRLAFPEHIQLWKVWTGKTAASKAVVSQTIGAYYGVAIFFAFDIGLYFFATNVLGWWTPSSALTDPDVLATYFPWLSSIGISLQAGFMEECLFRAVPIAGAVILGKKYGYKKAWLAGAFILQAVIFGAAHANYANQPAYARLVELIIPSIGFGLIYYYLGLLPGIILHFAYDVVWFALPVFASSATGIWIDQSIIILLTLVPLLIVLITRLRVKKWMEVDAAHLNKAFEQPPAEKEDIKEEKTDRTSILTGREKSLIWVLGITGLISWLWFADFGNLPPVFKPDRESAETTIVTALKEMGFEVEEPWQVMTCINASPGLDHRLVMQNGGDSLYREMLGKFLAPPRWSARIARFSGTEDERAEEYKVYIDPEGNLVRISHKLAESTTGARLDADSARAMAVDHLKTFFNQDAHKLIEVSATPSELDDRTDWVFEFSDTLNYPLDVGQGRYLIKISGSGISDAFAYLHIPEDIERDDRNEQNQMKIFSIPGTTIRVGIYILAVVLAIIAWSKKRFAVKPFLIVMGFVFFISLIKLFNNWPCTEFMFSTAQPFEYQQLAVIGLGIVGIIFFSAMIGFISGFTSRWNESPVSKKWSMEWLAAGLLIAGVMAIVQNIIPEYDVIWPDFSGLALAVPALGVISPLTGFMLSVSLYLFLYVALDILTAGWTKKKLLYGGLFILFIIVTYPVTAPHPGLWLAAGMVKAGLYLLLYWVFLRKNMMQMPLVLVIIFILEQIRTAVIGAFPQVEWVAAVSIIILILSAVFWSRLLMRETGK